MEAVMVSFRESLDNPGPKQAASNGMNKSSISPLAVPVFYFIYRPIACKYSLPTIDRKLSYTPAFSYFQLAVKPCAKGSKQVVCLCQLLNLHPRINAC
jgi:hypothetical protein